MSSDEWTWAGCPFGPGCSFSKYHEDPAAGAHFEGVRDIVCSAPGPHHCHGHGPGDMYYCEGKNGPPGPPQKGYGQMTAPGESPVEEMFWNACRPLGASGLPELQGLVRQHMVNAGWSNFYLDFAWPDLKLGIEIDGHATHSSPADIAKDRQRQRMLERAGWKIIRFGGSEVWRDSYACVREAAAFAVLERGRQRAS